MQWKHLGKWGWENEVGKMGLGKWKWNFGGKGWFKKWWNDYWPYEALPRHYLASGRARNFENFDFARKCPKMTKFRLHSLAWKPHFFHFLGIFIKSPCKSQKVYRNSATNFSWSTLRNHAEDISVLAGSRSQFQEDQKRVWNNCNSDYQSCERSCWS